MPENHTFVLPPQAERTSGQVCIVTGAASGSGHAIACLLARHGAIVVVADVTDTVIEGGVPTATHITSKVAVRFIYPRSWQTQPKLTPWSP